MEKQRRNLRLFVWNPEEKSVFGRQKKAWVEICLFFSLFYAVLIAWFCSMMCYFNIFVDDFMPTLRDSTSFLQHPGLAFRPQADYKSALISFSNKPKDPHNVKIIQSMDEALKPYLHESSREWTPYYRSNCSDDHPVDKLPCTVDTQYINSSLCAASRGYGYQDGANPCVMLRLNKIYNWKPHEYTAEDIDSSPMPLEVKNIAISKLHDAEKQYFIWVWCYGKTEKDQNNMGKITYLPEEQGYPYYYFPYRNQWGYLQPFVMASFSGLTPATQIAVACQVWAPDIQVNHQERHGTVEFILSYNKE